MKKLFYILFLMILAGSATSQTINMDTLLLIDSNLNERGKIYHLKVSGDTIFINGDTIIGQNEVYWYESGNNLTTDFPLSLDSSIVSSYKGTYFGNARGVSGFDTSVYMVITDLMAGKTAYVLGAFQNGYPTMQIVAGHGDGGSSIYLVPTYMLINTDSLLIRELPEKESWTNVLVYNKSSGQMYIAPESTSSLNGDTCLWKKLSDNMIESKHTYVLGDSAEFNHISGKEIALCDTLTFSVDLELDLTGYGIGWMYISCDNQALCDEYYGGIDETYGKPFWEYPGFIFDYGEESEENYCGEGEAYIFKADTAFIRTALGIDLSELCEDSDTIVGLIWSEQLEDMISFTPVDCIDEIGCEISIGSRKEDDATTINIGRDQAVLYDKITMVGTEINIRGSTDPRNSSTIYIGDNHGDDIYMRGDKISIGVDAGGGSSFSQDNIFIGKESGQSSDVINGVAFLGEYSGKDSDTIFSSSFIGHYAGYKGSKAANTELIGGYAGAESDSIQGSSCIGYRSGDGGNNIMNSSFMGYYSGKGSNKIESSNFNGYQSGYNSSRINNSAFLGYNSGWGADSIYNSTFAGMSAGYDSYKIVSSNFIGGGGYWSSNITSSTFIEGGMQADNITGSVYIGSSAGNLSNLNTYSAFIGDGSGYGTHDIDYCEYIGRAAGSSSYNNVRCQFIGKYSGQYSHDLTDCVFIGNQAGENQSSLNGELWIDITNTSTPLIRGYFLNDLVRINGGLEVRDYLKIIPSGAPSNPTEGQIYYDPGEHRIKVWNGTAWKSIKWTDD